VRVHPAAGTTVLEGDAHGVAALAAHGRLPAGALRYAGDLDPAELRRELERGGTLVLTDSNRRRVVNAARLRLRYGPTLGPDDDISPDSPTFELFDRESNDRRTLALYSGLRALESPIQPGQAIFPEHRAFAALDGELDTSWLADRNLDAGQRWIELRLQKPLRARTLRLHPHADARGATESVKISENGGGERSIELERGWNRIELSGDALSTLRIRIGHVSGAERGRGGGGIDELELPGLQVRETLRLPVTAAREARGADLSGSPIDVLLERTAADFPHRAGADVAVPQARSPLDAVDPEHGLVRRVTLPEARTFEISGWASVSPFAPDDELDRLAGLGAGWRMRSSSRFEGMPLSRASSAFDSDMKTAWVGDRLPGEIQWIEWRAPDRRRLSRLRLVPGAAEHATPARVRIEADGGESLGADVGPDGEVALPHSLSGREFRLEVLATRPARDAERRLRSVAIAEVEGIGQAAPQPRRSGAFATECGALTVAGVPARVSGTVQQFDSGRALRLRGCRRASMPAGSSTVTTPPGAVFRADQLRLASPAPRPTHVAQAGRVIDSGEGWNGTRDGVRLDLDSGGWLVLAEGWSKGWHAYCTGQRGGERDLGAPTPIDAFAVGWRAPAGCAAARFEFAPQKLATGSYLLSTAAVVAMLALLALSLLRQGALRRCATMRHAAPDPLVAAPARDPLVRLSWRWALAAGVAVGLVGGFAFALRAGVVLAPLAVLALRVGVNVRRLLVAAAVLIASLPLVYLVFPARDRGGNEFAYPADLLGAHWIAVLAVMCLLASGLLLAARLRRACASGSRSSTSEPHVPVESVQ
jgi:hypothetical protein